MNDAFQELYVLYSFTEILNQVGKWVSYCEDRHTSGQMQEINKKWEHSVVFPPKKKLCGLNSHNGKNLINHLDQHLTEILPGLGQVYTVAP